MQAEDSSLAGGPEAADSLGSSRKGEGGRGRGCSAGDVIIGARSLTAQAGGGAGRAMKRARTGGDGEGSGKGSTAQESELERDGGELWCEQFFAEEDQLGEEGGMGVFGVSPQG
eukprot:395535-Hanusia_phi.AAC.1